MAWRWPRISPESPCAQVANLGVAKLGRFVRFRGASLFSFGAGCCFVAAIALALIARRYRLVDYYRRA